MSSVIPLQGNVPPSIQEKIGKGLHLLPHHPLNILRKKIYRFFDDHFVDTFGDKIHFKKVLLFLFQLFVMLKY
jgi:hypothetical protein